MGIKVRENFRSAQVSDQDSWVVGSGSPYAKEYQFGGMRASKVISISHLLSLRCLWDVQREMDTRHWHYCFGTQR